MTRSVILLLIIAVSAAPLFAEYPPAGWTASITEGIAEARAEDKMLLLNFTGSDWCTWCEKLSTEVWETSEFIEWSEENTVKVFVDFPQQKNLSEEQELQNNLLQQYWISRGVDVRGVPSVLLFDSDMIPLLKTGYRSGGPEAYISHLEQDRNLRVENPEVLSNEFIAVIEEFIGPVN